MMPTFYYAWGWPREWVRAVDAEPLELPEYPGMKLFTHILAAPDYPNGYQVIDAKSGLCASSVPGQVVQVHATRQAAIDAAIANVTKYGLGRAHKNQKKEAKDLPAHPQGKK